VCYLRAVDDCYNLHMDRVVKAGEAWRACALNRPHTHTTPPSPRATGAARTDASVPTVDGVYDHVLFHSPYNKLVQQSYRRMLFNDARRLHKVRGRAT
jgi:3-hydroxy-3-methylglutaryl CoA synthase